MRIDFDQNERARAMLADLTISPDPTGNKHLCAIIPIDILLAARNYNGFLSGVPTQDFPDEISTYPLTKSDARRLTRLIERGKIIAVSAQAKRGKKNRGVKLDDQDEPILESFNFTWRNPQDYLDEEQIFWLKAMEAEKNRLAAELITQAQAEAQESQPTPAKRVKRKKLRRKDRRIAERREHGD
jgi:hypothetical protein